MTFFAGVSSIPPAHMAIVTPERTVVRRYWDFDPKQKIRFGSFNEYADAFRHHFERAVQRRLRSFDPVAVSVSGGLDSSAIFCVAATLRRQSPINVAQPLGFSYTYGDGLPSDETAFLAEIERHYDIVIDQIPAREQGFANGCEAEVWHAEVPLLDLQWNAVPEFYHSLRQRGARTLLTGHWGDEMLFDQAYLVDLAHQLSWRRVSAHLKVYRRWMTGIDSSRFRRLFIRDLVRSHVPNGMLPLLGKLKAKVFRGQEPMPWYSEAFLRLGRAHTSQPVSKNGSSATAHFKSLYQEVRSRYHVLCFEWNNKVAAMHGMDIAYPFLDRDLIAFLMAVPGEVQTWRGIPKALLREAMKDILPTPIGERRGKADFTAVINNGMERDLPRLAGLFKNEWAAHDLGYVNGKVAGEEVARLKKQVCGNDCSVAWQLRDLFGLELWLRCFFGAKKNCLNSLRECPS